MRDLVDEYYSTGGEPNLSDVGGIATGGGFARCEWCGNWTRPPCGCAAETEIDRLRTENERMRAELSVWERLHDPVILHANLLRGFPAQLSHEQLRHLIGDPPSGDERTDR